MTCLTEKSTEPTFTKDLLPGNLIRTKRPLTVYVLPGDEESLSIIRRRYLEENEYLLALTPVSLKKIGNTGAESVFRYQLFALINEEIICFTCTGINDRLIDSAFEIVQTGDPNA